MVRPPVGTLAQPLSDTALFAHIATRLEDVPVKRLEHWAGELGIRVGAKALRSAPRTAERLIATTSAGTAVTHGAVVDYAALDFFTALVSLRVVRGDTSAMSLLEQVGGVVELLTVERSEEVLALVIYERRSDKRALEAALTELADVIDWRPIEDRRPRAAISTFRALAQRAAKREQLLR
jgi:hypothetical protein